MAWRRLGSEALEDRRLLTITVDTLVDEADGSIVDGDVSLRDAIALAPDGETIDFSVTGTILLELGELVIDKDLTIAGPGAETLTIDASGNDPTPESFLRGFHDLEHPDAGDGSRVFNVDDGDADNNVDVEIRGLTLTGGDVDGNGGAIYSRESLTVADSHIQRNVAAPSSGYPLGGGAIFSSNDGGAVTITGSVVSHNWSTGEGGGIHARTTGFGHVTTTILDTTVTGNRSAGDGGGIFTDTTGIQSATIISGVTVSNNHSNGDGGGIKTSTRDLSALTTIDDATIMGNSSDERGGGISVVTGNAGMTDINNSTVARNTRGGIHTATSWDRTTTIVIAGSLITQNANESGGGGIVALGPLTVTHSTVSGNLALGSSADGGGIVGSSGLIVSYSVISGNATSGRGGGIQARQGITLTHSSVTDNTARYGGGAEISNAVEGETFISHSTFSGNSADISGGGINGFSFWGPTEIENTTISGNSAGRDGGGISATIRSSELFMSSLAIRHSTIVDNVAGTARAEHGSGGGILITGNTPPTLSHTIVAGNNLGDGALDDIVGTVDAGSDYNLVGVDAGLVGISDGASGNQVGTVATPLDPVLGPLADNGGPTLPGGNALLTHALLTGSPALDAGNLSFVPPPHTDERGISRVLDGNDDTVAQIDIGAVEYRPPLLPGDGNLDGKVDADDYLLWSEHYGDKSAFQPPIAPENGDFNGDGAIDGLDYIVWASNYGAGTAVSTSQQRAAQDAAIEAEDVQIVPTATARKDDAASDRRIDSYAIHRAFDAVFADLAVKKNAKHRRG